MVEVLVGAKVGKAEIARGRRGGDGGRGIAHERHPMGHALGLLRAPRRPRHHDLPEGAGHAGEGARRARRRRSGPSSTRRGGCARRRRRFSRNTEEARRGRSARRQAIIDAGEARGRGARRRSAVPASRITSSRRTKAVEARIAQAETQAVAEVRSRAIDVAAAAAGRILAEEAKGKTGEELVERSIEHGPQEPELAPFPFLSISWARLGSRLLLRFPRSGSCLERPHRPCASSLSHASDESSPCVGS